MAVPRAALRLAVDLLIWYCVPAVFLLLYVKVYSEPASAVAPHLLVIAAPFAAVSLTRLAVSRLVANAILRCAISSLVTSGVMAFLLLYYAFVLIGLHSWGGVVAWNVIPTYFAQAPELADALGASRYLAIGALGLIGAALVTGCWIRLRRFDWTAEIRASNSLVAVWVLAGFAVVGLEVYNFYNSPPAAQLEPVSLTLFPMSGTRDLEGHPVNPQAARALDSLEDAARSAYVPASVAAKRNLILIVVDALRPDHMSVFGYGRDTTPNLDYLQRAGNMRKAIAHASCGDTICGLLSLSDSKFPRKFSFRPFGLHEVLRRNGYRVHMILSGDHTNFYSLKSYYGTVDTFWDGTDARGRFLNDDQLLIDRLAAMPSWDGTPTMFQFHLMSVHILRKSDDTGKFNPSQRYLFSGRNPDTGSVGQVVESAVNFYDNGVVMADAVVAQLLDSLGRKGYLRNALVVVTADHGESLGEHGLFGHANSVREELLRVPVLLISYGYRGAAIDAAPIPLQVDIAPTILAEFGIPQPRTWTGQPMQERGGPAFAYFEEHEYAGLIDAREPGSLWKYWTDRRSGTEHAFNLSADPREAHDNLDAVPSTLRGEWRMQALSGTPLMVAGKAAPTH